MQLFTTTDTETMNPNDDQAVIEAMQAFTEARQHHNAAEAERRRMLRELQPGDERRPEPFDLEYLDAKRDAIRAHTAMDRAEAALTRARDEATRRCQAVLDVRIAAVWQAFEQDVLPQLRDHAERMDELLGQAERCGLRFPSNVLCSGPSVMSLRGIEEWREIVERQFRQ